MRAHLPGRYRTPLTAPKTFIYLLACARIRLPPSPPGHYPHRQPPAERRGEPKRERRGRPCPGAAADGLNVEAAEDGDGDRLHLH